MKELLDKINFPYPQTRRGQDKFIRQVYTNIENKKNILICAPTGLGKTISALAPAIYLAKQKKLSVICLTSRQTQANQVIRTIKDISQKMKLNPNLIDKDKKIKYLAFIGKRNMCAHHNKNLYPPQDFNDFCKKMKETGKCKYFKNMKNDDFDDTIKAILDESSNSFMDVEGFVNLCASNSLCPYELAAKKAYHADVIICDYNYLFASGIKENFLGKIGRDINECILIVDEAHNLPDRIRSSYSYILSQEMIKNALKELNDFVKSDKYDLYITNAKSVIEEIYFDKVLGDKTDYLMSQKEFLDKYLGLFKKGIEFNDIIQKLKDIEMIVLEERIISHIGRIATFLERWYDLDEENYVRILEKNITKEKTNLNLKIKCIDPAHITTEILNNSFASILMSATLSPIVMYKNILGLFECDLLELESPFAKENQLTLVINDVTTKYTARGSDMYKKIADHIKSILASAHDKNTIIFFPSYLFMSKILDFIDGKSLQRKVLVEERSMTKEEKEKFIDKFKEENGFARKSKVLFAVTSGSFAEGLDLPQNMLEIVIVVGLPLGVPDLYTNAVIRHFDKKFGKGQMYGYIQPAMSKIIQAAGRCIRTQEDRGVVVLMDNRFLWPLYAQTFPSHWKLKKFDDENLKLIIGNFFDR